MTLTYNNLKIHIFLKNPAEQPQQEEVKKIIKEEGEEELFRMLVLIFRIVGFNINA